jgi:hypothetical protein
MSAVAHSLSKQEGKKYKQFVKISKKEKYRKLCRTKMEATIFIKIPITMIKSYSNLEGKMSSMLINRDLQWQA